MKISIYCIVTLSTFVCMEGITWFTHKYVMHGFLWYLHKDHHQPKYHSVFEKNDSFFFIFAIPSIILFYFGIKPELNILFFIALGILLYGMGYFIVHDIFIHRRFKILNHINSPYLQALRKGHKMHHKHLEKEEGECFGMLYVPWKYFKEKYKS